jgi:hypothetical protein
MPVGLRAPAAAGRGLYDHSDVSLMLLERTPKAADAGRH